MKQRNIFIIAIATAAIIGFTAGIAGEFVSRAYLTRFTAFTDLYLPSQGQVGQREVIIQEARNVVVEQDVRVKQVTDKAARSVFGLYRKKNFGNLIVDQMYSPSERLASAIAVTSDGWLFAYTTQKVTPATLAVVKDGQVLDVEEVVADDSGLLFIKVTASNLPVIEFASTQNITSGQSLIAYDQMTGASQLTYLTDDYYRPLVNKYDLVQRVEDFEQRLLIDSEISAGLPLLNLNGEIVGMSDGGETAIKTRYVNFLLKTLLREQELQKPYLGVRYIELADAQGYERSEDQNGVVIASDAAGISVERNSPLFGKLEIGDIITSVESIPLNSSTHLADLLLDYRLGDSLTLNIVRGDEQLEVEYTMQERP